MEASMLAFTLPFDGIVSKAFMSIATRAPMKLDGVFSIPLNLICVESRAMSAVIELIASPLFSFTDMDAIFMVISGARK